MGDCIMLPDFITKPSKPAVIVNPIGSENLMFRRTTNRYSRKGTWSKNRGYLKVSRVLKSGRFTERP